MSTSQLGPNFYIGNHAGASGIYEPLTPGGGSAERERSDAERLAEQARGRALSPGEVSDYWLGLALEYIRSQPGDWLRLTGVKLRLTLNAAEIADTESLEVYAEHSARASRAVVVRLRSRAPAGGVRDLAESRELETADAALRGAARAARLGGRVLRAGAIPVSRGARGGALCRVRRLRSRRSPSEGGM